MKANLLTWAMLLMLSYGGVASGASATGANLLTTSNSPGIVPDAESFGAAPTNIAQWRLQRGASQRPEAVTNANGALVVSEDTLQLLKDAAEKGDWSAQAALGMGFYSGLFSVPKDHVQAAKWLRKAAEKCNELEGEKMADAAPHLVCYLLGLCYFNGQGVPQDRGEAVKWFRQAGEHGLAEAQTEVGLAYVSGKGGPKDVVEAAKWLRKAADQGEFRGQWFLGALYADGVGVAKNDIEAYKWLSLAHAHEMEEEQLQEITRALNVVEARMAREEIVEAQRLASGFKPSRESSSGLPGSIVAPRASGTGFFITENGFFVTSGHVVKQATQIRVVTSAGLLPARVVRADAANDLALLRAEGVFSALPLISSRDVRLGATVATVGFPNVGLQGFAPKLAKGEIAALSGPQDDPRYFQISVPVQPGNSGGALVDERGNVVGVVSAKLSATAALATSGALPENVNYATKSGFLLSFLESVPEVPPRLKEPATKEKGFQDVVRSAEQAAILVLVY